MLFIALDFPALERPANATSARLFAGQSLNVAALVKNWVSVKFIICGYLYWVAYELIGVYKIKGASLESIVDLSYNVWL
tara:strand:- start:542 stop:778 length:237 start_codon:yes stop_codon:yes gene_type:complete